MTWKSYALVSGAGVVATWLAAAPPSVTPGGVEPAQPREVSRAVAAASDIEEQAARLQARLRDEALYREPDRNPFRFADRRRGAAASQAPAARLADAPLPTEAPPLPVTLAGIATDDGVRTAILSTPAGVVLAQVGDEVLDRFRVSAIGTESIDLVSIAGAATLTLSF